jgi:hypothetical protein
MRIASKAGGFLTGFVIGMLMWGGRAEPAPLPPEAPMVRLCGTLPGVIADLRVNLLAERTTLYDRGMSPEGVLRALPTRDTLAAGLESYLLSEMRTHEAVAQFLYDIRQRQLARFAKYNGGIVPPPGWVGDDPESIVFDLLCR